MYQKLSSVLFLSCAIAFQAAAEAAPVPAKPVTKAPTKTAKPAKKAPTKKYDPKKDPGYKLYSTNKIPLKASMVIDANSGEVLTYESAYNRVHPASLTKMMTLYLTFEAIEAKKLSLQQVITLSPNAANQTNTRSIPMRPNFRVTIEQAILGTAVKSANNLAVALGETVSGSEKEFVKLMNLRAQELGMEDTHFKNPTGLPDDEQVTTAADMLLLVEALYTKYPQYVDYLGRKEITLNIDGFVNSGMPYKSHLNKDGMLDNSLGVRFGKTGFINASGFNVALMAEKDGKKLYAVVFGGRTPSLRDEKMVSILTEAFTRASLPPLPTFTPIPLLPPAESYAQIPLIVYEPSLLEFLPTPKLPAPAR